jgi:hypothetical protein
VAAISSPLNSTAYNPMTKNNLLFDTCVWFTLAQDIDASPMLQALKGHVDSGTVVLLVPTIVVDEFERNREKIIQKYVSRLRTQIKHAHEATALLDGADAEEMKRLTEKAEKKIVTRAESVAQSLNLASDLLHHKKSIKIPHQEIHYTRVVERALTKRAPFHRNKNSVADALHMESFHYWVKDNSDLDSAIFVSENTSDYCNDDKKTEIHADYKDYFSKTNWNFSINVAEVIETLGPFEHSADVKARYATMALVKSGLCPQGGDHVFSEGDGAYLRSQYGGLTWQLFCTKCHARFDTGDSWD